MPCDQSRLASGMFPTEQTNESIAMIGPTSAFSIKRTTVGPLCRNKASHQPCGISVAKNPAIKNPPRISFQSIDQSVTNACATRVHFDILWPLMDGFPAANSCSLAVPEFDEGGPVTPELREGGCS